MQNAIIYLIGFPGAGKYTIAKEICARTDARLVDNHLINNPVFSLLREDGHVPLPKGIWSKVEAIWNIVLETIEELCPPERSFVLTNALRESDPEDRAWFNRIADFAQKRGSVFLPVRLICDAEELRRRIVSPDREARMKEMSPENSDKRCREDAVLSADHPNTLTLDVTGLSPAQAAEKIIAELEAIVKKEKTLGRSHQHGRIPGR